jgi:hypothetical protein
MRSLHSITLTTCLVTFGGLSLHAQDVTGTGTANTIPIWTTSSKIGNSVLTQAGTNVGVHKASPIQPLDVTGNVNTSTGYMIGGELMLAAPGGITTFNTALGVAAVSHISSGTEDTGIGYEALAANTTGIQNSALGYLALANNTTGNSNTAVGMGALGKSTSGSSNTVVGLSALQNLLTGSGNIAIGATAGNSAPSTVNDSIYIGSVGASTDSDVIRIGTQGTQTAFYAAGIHGVTTGTAAIEVFVDASGQLGTKSSSIRFKEDVHDMADASDGLLQLRPVTYRYKQPYADGSKPVDYGLIAEEVAQVYPDLVARNANGQIEAVQYSKLTPMLLNEVQKQHQEMQKQNQLRSSRRKPFGSWRSAWPLWKQPSDARIGSHPPLRVS